MNFFSNWKWKAARWRAAMQAKLTQPKKARRPRICPNCGTLVGSTSSRCYQCGTNLNFSLAATSRYLSRLLPSTSPVTYVILTVSCLLYGATLLATIHQGGGGTGGGLFGLGGINGQVLINFGASLPLPYIVQQPWRLVMATFLHGGLLHIGMNMWVLMDIAPVVEELYGSARFFFVYIITGIAGYILSSATGHFSIGASASLLGLIGILLAITTKRGGASMQMLRGQLVRWIIYIAIFGLLFHGVDNMAHLGGLASGFLIGRIMADHPPTGQDEHKRAILLGWGSAAVVALCFVMTAWSFLRPS